MAQMDITKFPQHGPVTILTEDGVKVRAAVDDDRRCLILEVGDARVALNFSSSMALYAGLDKLTDDMSFARNIHTNNAVEDAGGRSELLVGRGSRAH